MAEPQPLLAPNSVDMRAHIEHVFSGFLDGHHDGRIELAWTDAKPDAGGRYALRHGETYALDDDSIDLLIARAVEVNSKPRANVYIGGTLRRPEIAPFGRCSDEEYYATSAVYCDLDDKDANDAAKHRFIRGVPTLVVCTGDYPHWRHQLWFRLTETITDAERHRAIIAGIAACLGGDGTISNPSRVMRLAGTIAWDQKPGRRPELTRIVPLKAGAPPAYMAEHLEAVYPPLYSFAYAKASRTRTAAPGPDVGIVRARDAFGLRIGKVEDGRERWMRNLICARLRDYCGLYGSVPTADELFEFSWEEYERSTDLNRPGRNKPEFAEKCRATLQRFEQGKIRGLEGLEAAIVAYKLNREARKEYKRVEAEQPREEQQPDEEVKGLPLFEYLDIPAIKALPDPKWAVQDLIIEDSLGFVYGPPGHGKSFVCLNLALHIAYGLSTWWFDKAIERKGLVVYIAREGVAGLKDRIEAWQRQHGIESDAGNFILIRAGINFMVEEDISKLIATLEAALAVFGVDPSLIVVDTVSRVLPGADENLQREMTLFVKACDLVRDRYRATVIGVHHAGKSGDMRGSTVLKGAGDFVFKVERPEEGQGPTRFVAEKIKDGEDGWGKDIELRREEWQRTGAVDAARVSLVAQPVEIKPVGAAAKKTKGWPEKDVCRRILAHIETAWARGEPWSPHPQARIQGRYAPALIANNFDGVSAQLAKTMIETWTMNKILKVEEYDKRNKATGLHVIGGID